MTRIRNVGGTITKTTIGNHNIYSEGNIVQNAGGTITETGEEKGVSFNKPKTYKPKTDLKITKVEGPFDDKDKLVKMVKIGLSYTYKATSSRKLEKGEEKLLKWATKNDDGKIKELGGVSSHNVLAKDGKILIGVIINEDCEKAKIYAYFKKASDSVNVEVNVFGVFRPYIVAKSRHRKGMNEEGTAKHHDMMSGDMTDSEIIALNPDTKKWIDIVNKEGLKGIQKLANEMEDLLTDFSQGDLEDVNLKMYQKFVQNKPGDFTDEVLTKAVKEHEHSNKFFDRIKKNLKIQLNSNSNFIFEKKLMPCLLNIETFKGSGIYRIDIPSPSYPDKYGGLGIAINDTWGYDITITRFQQDVEKRTFSAELSIEIFDHYGLNSEDIDPKIKGGFLGSASFEGFLCWFVLQHKCGYKPFLNIMKISNKIINENY